MQEALGNFPGSREDERIATGGDGLDAPEDVIVQHDELPHLRKVLADQGEVVFVIKVPDGADPVQRLPVSYPGSQGIAGISGVGDEAAVLDHVHNLADGARLWVNWVDVKESGHGMSLRQS